MKVVPAVFGVRPSQPSVFGVEFTERGLGEIADLVSDAPAPGSGLQLIATMNLDHVVTLRRDPHFRSAYRNASIVTADGFPVYLYARCRGARLAGRVCGSDLFPLIMSRMKPGQQRPLLVASNERTHVLLEQHLIDAGFRPDQFAVVVPPFGFETDTLETEALLALVERLHPTHIFMGVGAPKSEVWLHQHRNRLGDTYGFAFGASLDFFVGTARRAPKIMRNTGLEWLWRFGGEPRRLFKRYFVDSWAFFAVVADDLRHNGKPFPPWVDAERQAEP
jgi:N-acetylglucosaminyldiphosphoundecaprenol N-acetyl-beta-D-mannosaminyltransferase